MLRDMEPSFMATMPKSATLGSSSPRRIFSQQDILRFDVSVDQSLIMRGSDAFRDAPKNANRMRERQGTICRLKQLPKARSFNVFHSDEKAAILCLVEIVYLNNVSMLQPSELL